MGLSPRQRRLRSDLRALTELQEQSTFFRFAGAGDPPDRYRVAFHGRGLARDDERGVHAVLRHEVLLLLGPSYPRVRPDLKWETPLFHPNVSEGGLVCLGGYSTDWVPGLTIDRLCSMLWDMARWANFDVRSPYNLRAARWARLQTDYAFPLDDRPLRDRLRPGDPPTPGTAPPPTAGIRFREPAS